MCVHMSVLCCVQALHAFKTKYGVLPRPWNQEDAGKFVEVAREVNGSAQAKVRGWDEVEWGDGEMGWVGWMG